MVVCMRNVSLWANVFEHLVSSGSDVWESSGGFRRWNLAGGSMSLWRGVFEDLYFIFLYLAIYVLSLPPFPVLPLFLICGQKCGPIVSHSCWRFPLECCAFPATVDSAALDQ